MTTLPTPEPPPLPPGATTSTASPDNAALAAAATLRLHPLSWLFILLRQLKAFALPLVVLLVGGRGEQNTWDLIGAAAASLIAVGAVWQYFTYRYGFLEHALVIRSGLLQRNLRLIPFDRIQNVTLNQNVLHRLFKVAELKLESAGGMGQAEAQMQVLPLPQAHALEQRVRQGAVRRRASLAGDDGPAADATAPSPAGEREWLRLPTAEVVRLGLISNRGMLVVAAGFAVLSQAGGDVMDAVFSRIGDVVEQGIAVARDWHLGPLAWAAAGALLLLGLLASVRLLSVALAILQFHGFRLDEDGHALRVERGLLTRVRGHLPRHRIQAYALHESLLHRWFGRQSLRVDRAAMEAENDGQSLRDLAPIAPPATLSALLDHLLPGASWPPTRWQPLHRNAWWRVFSPWLWIVLAVTAAWTWWDGLQGLWALAALPLAAWRARLWARHSAWSLQDGVLCYRQGWLDRRWRFAEVRKLQTFRLAQGPIDRRHGMATLWIDSIGASPFDPIHIPYLPVAEAEALLEKLREGLPRDDLNRARTAASTAPAG